VCGPGNPLNAGRHAFYFVIISIQRYINVTKYVTTIAN
jgi:hypothetical protein